MILCVAGDIHGGLDRMYAEVLAFEAAVSVRFARVLHVGDFGIWPDASRIDGATRRHEGAGDFATWPAERRAAPRPTVFIKGNHDDFVWLDTQPSAEVLLALFYLRNGLVQELRSGGDNDVPPCRRYRRVLRSLELRTSGEGLQALEPRWEREHLNDVSTLYTSTFTPGPDIPTAEGESVPILTTGSYSTSRLFRGRWSPVPELPE